MVYTGTNQRCLGQTVWPGVLSGLEVCVGIVACCAVTWRPLIEKLFGSSTKKESSTGSSNVSTGWKRIHVQRDVFITEDHGASAKQPSNEAHASQEWELRPIKHETRLE